MRQINEHTSTSQFWNFQVILNAGIATRSGGSFLALTLAGVHIAHCSHRQVGFAVALFAALRSVVPVAVLAFFALNAGGATHAGALTGLHVALRADRSLRAVALLAAATRREAPRIRLKL